MATLLMSLPASDFDPTESQWRTMRDHRHHAVFHTPTGRTARAIRKW
jgi:hypothetical protein